MRVSGLKSANQAALLVLLGGAAAGAGTQVAAAVAHVALGGGRRVLPPAGCPRWQPYRHSRMCFSSCVLPPFVGIRVFPAVPKRMNVMCRGFSAPPDTRLAFGMPGMKEKRRISGAGSANPPGAAAKLVYVKILCLALVADAPAKGRSPCCGAQNFRAALRRTLEILTAATRSPRCIRHRRRSDRSPGAAAKPRVIFRYPPAPPPL